MNPSWNKGVQCLPLKHLGDRPQGPRMGLPQGTNLLNFTINIDNTDREIETNSKPKANRKEKTLVRHANGEKLYMARK